MYSGTFRKFILLRLWLGNCSKRDKSDDSFDDSEGINRVGEFTCRSHLLAPSYLLECPANVSMIDVCRMVLQSFFLSRRDSRGCRLIASSLREYFYVTSIFRASRINETSERLASSQLILYIRSLPIPLIAIYFSWCNSAVYKAGKIPLHEINKILR